MAITNSRLRSPGNKAEPVNGKDKQNRAPGQEEKERQTRSIMLTSDAAEDQRSTKNTVIVFFMFPSSGVTLEHSGIRETSCLCNSCYSTVTSNCRYVVFSSATDCPLFAEAPTIWDSPVIEFQTPANQQIPKSQQLWKVIWNKKLTIKPYPSDNSLDHPRRAQHNWLRFFLNGTRSDKHPAPKVTEET